MFLRMIALSLPKIDSYMDKFGKIIKIGNSCGLIIPAQMMKELSLGEHDNVKLRLDNRSLVITKQEPYTGPFTGPFADLPHPGPGEPDPWGGMDGKEWEEMLRSGSGSRSVEWE